MMIADQIKTCIFKKFYGFLALKFQLFEFQTQDKYWEKYTYL